jgi:hypothetical protein
LPALFFEEFKVLDLGSMHLFRYVLYVIQLLLFCSCKNHPPTQKEHLKVFRNPMYNHQYPTASKSTTTNAFSFFLLKKKKKKKGRKKKVRRRRKKERYHRIFFDR